MKADNKARFDVNALRNRAGEKVFARGEAYFRSGQVEILSIEPERVVAQVSGTEDYRTVLTGRGKRIGGECSCPAFEEWGFCKHMVAVALVANAEGGEAKPVGEGTLSRIRQHLKSKSVDALVEMIVELAERDAKIYRKLELTSATRQADDPTLEANLRKAIDKATRTRGFVEYREVGDWAAGVDGVLDAVVELLSNGRSGLALKLVDHALSRIETAIQNVDDSDGYCGGLLDRACETHLAACMAARPDPVKLAGELFSREMNDQYGNFDGAAATYSDVLGDVGLAEYRRRASEAWGKLPPRSNSRGSKQDYDVDYDCLKRILDFFAERDGDVESRIALRSKDLSSPWKYLELAEFCLSQGREEEALRRAEEGLWIFEDGPPDGRLVGFTAQLLSRKKRKSDAEELLWRAFEKAPSFEFYGKLRLIGGMPARERAIAFLEARLAKEKPSQWHFPSTLLIQILMQEKMFDQAWQIARRHGASPGLAEDLARASETSHPAEALEVYAQRVTEMVNIGSGYEEAAQLVVRMAGLRGATEQSAYVDGLKERYHRKRNFMKLLG
jgi:tetratricopeptide (TPR) repeat protein